MFPLIPRTFPGRCSFFCLCTASCRFLDQRSSAATRPRHGQQGCDEAESSCCSCCGEQREREGGLARPDRLGATFAETSQTRREQTVKQARPWLLGGRRDSTTDGCSVCRPRAGLDASESEEDARTNKSTAGRDEGDEADDAHAAMLAALEAHQASFFGDALPFASTSSGGAGTGKKGRTSSAATQKSVWEMDDDDFLDEGDDDDDDEEEDDEGSEEEDEQTGPMSNAAKAARGEGDCSRVSE